MGLVAYLAVVGALIVYAFHVLFDALVWGFIVALIIFILGMDASARDWLRGIEPAHSLAIEKDVRIKRVLAPRNGQGAILASIAVGLGITLGWLLGKFGDDRLSARLFIALHNDRLLATAPLKAALEKIPSSGALIPFGTRENVQFRAKMTFENQSGAFCRQYELAFEERERLAAIACRLPDGNWEVVLQSLLPLIKAGVTVPAGASQGAALDAATGALASSDPFVGQAEAAIMNNGWRR